MGTPTDIPVLPAMSGIQRGTLAEPLAAELVVRLHTAPVPAHRHLSRMFGTAASTATSSTSHAVARPLRTNPADRCQREFVAVRSRPERSENARSSRRRRSLARTTPHHRTAGRTPRPTGRVRRITTTASTADSQRHQNSCTMGTLEKAVRGAISTRAESDCRPTGRRTCRTPAASTVRTPNSRHHHHGDGLTRQPRYRRA